MDGSTLVQMIGSLGFPIAACCYMFYIMEKEREGHREEMNKITDALNNNTLALQHLSDTLNK